MLVLLWNYDALSCTNASLFPYAYPYFSRWVKEKTSNLDELIVMVRYDFCDLFHCFCGQIFIQLLLNLRSRML